MKSRPAHFLGRLSCGLLFVMMAMLTAAVPISAADPKPVASKEEAKTLRVLFIGNSYTARHSLAQVVKAMAEAGNPGLTVEVSTVIYGGRRLVDHWRLGTQNFVRRHSLTVDEQRATIAALEQALAENPKDNKYAKSALPRQRTLLEQIEGNTGRGKKWDVVVLQSYRDDIDSDGDGKPSFYAQYAPKFAELIKAQGGRVVLYETSPTTQNAEALKAAPDPAPVMAKERAIAALANRIDASVAPMSIIALKCQTERPELTLRFVNDAHLNHTMAYLSACAIYAAIFERSPQGLAVDSITDIRFFNNKERDKDRDGQPIKRTFSEKDRADLQRIAWEGWREFQALRKN